MSRELQSERVIEMNANAEGERDGDGNSPRLLVDKVRDVVDQIKSHEATQPHGEELESHLTALEAELGKEEPHHTTLASLLDGLRGLSAEASEALINSGVMNLMNEILGTGVPPVGPRR